ncbi:Ankyrin repeat-containing protein [Glarea lozoyensis ATCC 20868]|uniref:Ankyrin repeat-containing protein n=1 Tax=Glarea lozoyensis (strain ATCC 20868 / MF5171) TaxID=1116229 RepID=S3DMP6_GLAL2|nr:Ankyrin repeat-containing protein [Glarea lozoyensis ATCC 20868]EPE33351.1 Ankyrin repeat-containing protein [Glarea lozoyensis ATCC 20868]
MAVQLGDIALVKNLLNNGADLEARNGEGQTPLHIATLNHNLEVIKVLFGAGINVEAKDNKRTAPIHYAADSGKELIVRLLVNRLLEMKSTVDIPDRQGATALYRAAANGHASIVSILLQVAADKSGRPGLRLTESTNSALKAAISGGYQEVVDVLLSAGCRPTHSELEKAVVGGNLDIVDALLNAGANVNKRPSRFNRTALQAAIEGRHEMIVARLLAAGARTDEEVWDGSYIMTPLHIAVRTSQRSVNIVKKLLAAGANVNEIGGNLQTPLQEATGLGDEEMIELLSAASAEANPGREISCAALLPGFETNGRGFFANYFLGACPDPAATETNSEKGNQL